MGMNGAIQTPDGVWYYLYTEEELYGYNDDDYYYEDYERVYFYPMAADLDLSKYQRTFPQYGIESNDIDTDGGVSTFYMSIYNDMYDYEDAEYCYMEAVLNEDNLPVNGFEIKEDPTPVDERGPYGDYPCSKVGKYIPYNQEDNSIDIDGTKYTLHSEEDMMNSYDYNDD